MTQDKLDPPAKSVFRNIIFYSGGLQKINFCTFLQPHIFVLEKNTKTKKSEHFQDMRSQKRAKNLFFAYTEVKNYISENVGGSNLPCYI